MVSVLVIRVSDSVLAHLCLGRVATPAASPGNGRSSSGTTELEVCVIKGSELGVPVGEASGGRLKVLLWGDRLSGGRGPG